MSAPTLSARPGRRSRRLNRLADPAITPPVTMTSAAAAYQGRSSLWLIPKIPVGRVRLRRIAAAAIDASGMPVIFNVPVVISPRASADRWPRRPLEDPDSQKSSTAPRPPAAAVASRVAVRWRGSSMSRLPASSPAVTAGPSASETSCPAWLVRTTLSWVRSRDLSTAFVAVKPASPATAVLTMERIISRLRSACHRRMCLRSCPAGCFRHPRRIRSARAFRLLRRPVPAR